MRNAAEQADEKAWRSMLEFVPYNKKWAKGWSKKAFDQAWIDQGGRCAICKKQMTLGLGRGIATAANADHSHRTGEPRSLLCGHCNRGLGHFKDDPELLREAASYLEKHIPVVTE